MIIERSISGIAPDGVGGWVWLADVLFIDDSRAADDQIHDWSGGVPFSVGDNDSQIATKRSAGYRAAMIADMGSAPNKVKLINTSDVQ